VHIDFAQIRDGHYLIMVDAHSKWPEVIKMSRGTSAERTIEALRTVFGRMGICPEEIVSDNGPPFSSKEFKLFLQNNGVKHILSAPYHPSYNGEAERFVRSFTRGMKHNTGRVSKNHTLQEFLLSYRTTPHTLTGKTPSEMVFGRRVRTRMDLVRPNLKEKIVVNLGVF
jgi:transposase InsO family protein